MARALADGTLRVEQARVIVEAVDALPSHVDDDVSRAEPEPRCWSSLASTTRAT